MTSQYIVKLAVESVLLDNNTQHLSLALRISTVEGKLCFLSIWMMKEKGDRRMEGEIIEKINTYSTMQRTTILLDEGQLLRQWQLVSLARIFY